MVASAIPSTSPLLWGMLIGLASAPLFRRLPTNGTGMAFASRTLLRAGVALLGLQVSLDELVALGPSALAICVATPLITFAVTLWVAPRVKVPRDLGLLLAMGTAVCGASAIVAANTAIRAREDAVSYAIAIVTLIGTVAMVLVPLVGQHVLGLSPREVGLWAGASLQEVGQVTAAGAAVSAAALEVATLVKLGRVALLVPLVALTSRLAEDPRGARPSAVPVVPGFLVAFALFALVRTLVPLEPEWIDLAHLLSTGLLTIALVAVGLQVDLRALRTRGHRPVALGLISWLVATGVALLMVILLPG